jgi:hypothetical protein
MNDVLEFGVWLLLSGAFGGLGILAFRKQCDFVLAYSVLARPWKRLKGT